MILYTYRILHIYTFSILKKSRDELKMCNHSAMKIRSTDAINICIQYIASQWSKEGTTEQWGLTQAIFSEDMRNVTGWRHPGAGRIVRWEDVLVRVHGDRWRETAMDRARWRSLRASFVASACDALLGHGHRVFGVGDGRAGVELAPQRTRRNETAAELSCGAGLSISCKDLLGNLEREERKDYAQGWELARPMAVAMAARLRQGVVMQLIGDSRVLVDCLLGRACTEVEAMRRWLSHAQEYLLHLVRGCALHAPRGRELAQHVFRSDNGAADAAANQALDEGSFRQADGREALRFLQYLMGSDGQREQVGVLFAFDGASRGNPGDAALGTCAWWGGWSDGSFSERGLLMRRGDRLGVATNNYAEAAAMSTALREAVRWHFEVSEELARLTRSTRQAGRAFEWTEP